MPQLHAKLGMDVSLRNMTALPVWNEAATAFALVNVVGGCAGIEGLRYGKSKTVEAADSITMKPKPLPVSTDAVDDEKGEEVEDPATSERLLAMLDAAGVAYRKLEHAPVLTSEAAAEVRGVDLASGAKAMLFAANRAPTKQAAAEAAGEPTHYLVVLSAAKRLDIKAVRKLFGRSLRFASAAELKTVAGCIAGAVPPFGSVFLGGRVQTIVDRSLLLQGPAINFNCGLRTASVCDLLVEDFLRLEAGHAVHNLAE